MIELVLFIHHGSGAPGYALREAVSRRFPGIPRKSVSGVDSLRERLKHPVRAGEQTIYVVLADTPERLSQLQRLKAHLEDKRLLLILPDNRKETRSAGLTLLPRFISYCGDGFGDLAAVLDKMIAPDRYHPVKTGL